MNRALLAGCLCVATFTLRASDPAISLQGRWRFQLDRNDAGIDEKWFARVLPQVVDLPGSLPAQGIGYDVTTNTPWTGGVMQSPWFTAPEYAKYRARGNVKVPFWLTPDKYYAGAAWYQREIEIPAAWAGRRIVLFLDRPHWETRVWVDERLIGTNNALATPHEYYLGPLAPGKHTCTIRVDNRMVVDIGENSHSISDHTQGDWNGVVGRIELRATPRVWIDDLQVYPELAQKRVRLKIAAGNASGGPVEVELVSKLAGHHLPNSPPFPEQRTAAKLAPGLSTIEITYPLGERAQSCFLWDEFSPRLYSFQVRLRTLAEPRMGDDRSALFGFREISAPGSQFLINNRKTFFRGTLDCCVYPKTGHPPTDVESWKRVIRVCKAHGLNLVRFHSWCPPEAAFVAADELGFYLHVEASAWANQSTTLGDGKPVDNWVYAETDGILKYYGNHPSFILMAYGNEPGGKNYAAYLTKYVDYYKSLDPRRLWTSASGWPELPGNQFHVTPDPRIQGWGEGLKSRINGKPPETVTDYRNYVARRSVPVISHEIGQWCVFPNFEEIKKYTGYLKPKNFEIFRDSLNAHHLGGRAHQFLLASGKLQALCYKEEIESALRTPGMGGFELLDLHDFPGQGTALVGVLDPFWESKGYVTPKEYTRFCNSVVPLARLAKRVFTADEMLDADLEIANFSPGPLAQAQIVWELADGAGKVRAHGGLPVKTLPVGNGISLGRVSAPLASLDTPAKYKLIVSVKAEGSASRRLENDWDVWVYPPNVDLSVPADIRLTDDLDQDALDKLNAGGKVLLNIPPKRVRNDEQEPVKLGFSSIFWNTAWTSRQAPTTLGVFCDPKHPVFAQFPTEYHSNWQWWYLVNHASAMILDDLPDNLLPTVQVIDDWVTNRKLGLLFEARVGAGKLMACSIDLQHGLENDPVRRQFRHSLLRYMSGSQFNPPRRVTVQQVRGVIATPGLAHGEGLGR